jgi:hypothetical protein
VSAQLVGIVILLVAGGCVGGAVLLLRSEWRLVRETAERNARASRERELASRHGDETAARESYDP